MIKDPINKIESQGDMLEADICNIYNRQRISIQNI